MAKVELDIRAQITNLNKGLDKTEKQLKDLQQQSNKTSKTIQGNMNKTNTAVTKLTGALGAMLTIGAAVQFTKAIINVRKEFETFRAVLTNTLGSSIAANREFEKIQKFAKETPFSVRELTDSFVRLTNQGFKPTADQMRQLGDLAAAVGKSFVQLTEAIIDAQVGEFERLKEFGIRARKEGDLVTFTFKEQQTQVEFTADAIQGYILSLGDLEGVSGAMAAISETLEGKLSNLGDAWDGLLDVLGGRTSSVMIGVIDLLGEVTDRVQGLLEVADPQIRAATSIDDLKISLAKLDRESQLEEITMQFNVSRSTIARFREEIDKLTPERQGKLRRFFGSGANLVDQKLLDAQIQGYKDAIVQLKIEEDSLRELSIEIANGTVILKELEEENVIQSETITTLIKKLKDLEADKRKLNITDIESIEIKNREIEAIKNQIKELNNLGIVQKVKTPKIEDIVIDEGKGIIDLEKELADESLAIQKQLDQDILDSQLKRIAEQEQAIIAAELQKRLLADGTVEAVMSGLDLLAAANKDNAAVQQAVSIAQSIINGAVGITKTGAELGYPAAIPFQIALGLQTLAQIATIRSQKFERGGYDVLSGRRHAQGGIAVGFGEEAEDGEGRAFFTRSATKKYGKFLPAFVKAINEDKLNDVTDSGSYNFNFDDSRSVNELKNISKLLSKKDVDYENGYRIETRNGHRTKVRI